MKLNVKHLKIAIGVAVPVSVTVGYILELRTQLKGTKFRAKYMEEKLNSVLEMLDPDQLEKIADEVDSDIEFFKMTTTSLKDVL